MSAWLRGIAKALGGTRPSVRMLGGFVDSLIQTFENCRPGLIDESLAHPAGVEAYVSQLYDKERPQLSELVRLEHPELPEAARRAMEEKVDDRIRRVLIPAYARLAARFTRRERNDFYLTPEAWHAAERVGLSVAGMLVGAFIIWAPFIPLWSKEWVAVFGFAGLVFPELRRVLAFGRYQSELNSLVGRTDDEIFRMDLALLTRETEMPVREAGAVAPHGSVPAAGTRDKSREGGR